MKISENKIGIEWLRQFNAQEVHLARILLDSLRLVSFQECESAVLKALENVCSQTTGTLAFVTASKNVIDPSSILPGSEYRLAHLIRNIHRQFPERILINPDVEKMRSEKVKNVVIIDDLVCSGQRSEDFWDVWTSTNNQESRFIKGKQYHLTRKRGSLRSWLSFGYCKLWLVAYAIHEVGLERLTRRIPYLSEDRCVFDLLLKKNIKYWPDKVSELLMQTRSAFAFGWGNLVVPIVFQHGCPDNCPKILWESSGPFRSLFPNRSVPTALYPCFEGGNDSGRGPSLLLKSGQSRLALALIEEMLSGRRDKKYTDILTVLGLLLSGYSLHNLSGILLREESKISEILKIAQQLSLVDSEYQVTRFGRDIVERSRKSFLTSGSFPPISNTKNDVYIPRTFQNKICGVRRKSRNQPETKP